MPDDRTIAWVDMTGRARDGKASRLHRRDVGVHAETHTACGLRIPRRLHSPRSSEFARHFEITAEESTGQCRRCFPYSCVRCRRRRHDGECCSSHAKRLCHTCYRVTHFVEVCAPSCSQCAAEGLPLIYPPLRAREAPEPAVQQ